jgi:iron(III) transport system ATP-binding protein
MISSYVRLENISKRYGSAVAVDDLSIQLSKGEFFTLLGASGSGKTTTLRIVAGFVKPDSGQVYVGDRQLTDLPPNSRNIGMVFQNFALFPHMTVFDNVAFGLKIRKVGAREISDRVGEALEMVRLLNLQYRIPKQLSGGQQQRVAIARAIVTRPDVLLLDEPLSNLDFKLRIVMRQEIRNLHKQTGLTTFYITHDQGEALSMSDRVGIIDNGRIQQIGRPREIYERPANRFVAHFIGEANILEGKVRSVIDSLASIEVENGAVFYSEIDHIENKSDSESSVTISIRPERIALTKNKPNVKNSNFGKVEALDYQGSSIRYQLSFHGLAIFSECSNVGKQFEIGDEVYFSFEPKDCLILN